MLLNPRTSHPLKSDDKSRGYWRKEGGWKALIGIGWLLFWLAGVSGDRLPSWSLLVGPALMLIGLIRVVKAKDR